MVDVRCFNGGYDVRIVQVALMYAIGCTVRFCVGDGDDFIFATHDIWLLDGFKIEVILANLSN